MIDRLILSVAMAVTGWNGLFPEPPAVQGPLTTKQLKQKAKERQLSAICQRKKGQKQSKTVKENVREMGETTKWMTK
jgi:hypothetical protein